MMKGKCSLFLISRIHEETSNNDQATVIGLFRLAESLLRRLSLTIVLTGAFAFTGVVLVKQIGIGEFNDATIIRLLLVPFLMKLLGDWNWWLPFSKR